MSRPAAFADPHTSVRCMVRREPYVVDLDDALYLLSVDKCVGVRTRARMFWMTNYTVVAFFNACPERYIRLHRNCIITKTAPVSYALESDEAGRVYWYARMAGIPGERLLLSRRCARALGLNPKPPLELPP